jgi:hypothetical protein
MGCRDQPADQEIPKGLQFMAGKLAFPLVVWRSYQLFQTSAEDLQQHRWQHALKTFAGGVAEVASLRQELDQLFPQDTAPPEPVLWNNGCKPPCQKRRAWPNWI